MGNRNSEKVSGGIKEKSTGDNWKNYQGIDLLQGRKPSQKEWGGKRMSTGLIMDMRGTTCMATQ